MSEMPGFSFTASLVADPARATMLTALLDGRALPAGELAYAAGVAPQTASSHLAKLLSGGLIAVENEGRHRYYRLAGAHVAQALEYLSAIRPHQSVKRRTLSPKGRELRLCRRCYDHLAGQVGVALACGLQKRGFIVAAEGKRFQVTAQGIKWFATIGLDVHALEPTRHGLARQCLDWTERRHHLAGPLGVDLMRVMCEGNWLRRVKDSRALQITPCGWKALRDHFGIDAASVTTEAGIASAYQTQGISR